MKRFLFLLAVILIGSVTLYVAKPSHFVFIIVDHHLGTSLYVPTKQEVAQKKERAIRADKLFGCIDKIGPHSALQTIEFDTSKMMTVDFVLFERRFNEKYCAKYTKCLLSDKENKMMEYVHYSDCLKNQEKTEE